MPEKAPNLFETQHSKFKKSAGAEVVKRAVVLRDLKQLETQGMEMTSSQELDSDSFAVTMNEAYSTVLDRNEAGEIKPPLSANQQKELVANRAIYNAFLPKTDEKETPAEPTDVDKIDTDKKKA